jgi:hypothetical protein
MKKTILTIIVIVIGNTLVSSNDWLNISKKISHIYTDHIANAREINEAFSESKAACYYDSLVVWYDEIRNQINFIDSLNINVGDTLYFTEDFDIYHPFHSQAWKNRALNSIFVYKKYSTKSPLKTFWISEDDSEHNLWRTYICNWDLDAIRSMDDLRRESVICAEDDAFLTYVFRVIIKQDEITVDFFNNNNYTSNSVQLSRMTMNN